MRYNKSNKNKFIKGDYNRDHLRVKNQCDLCRRSFNIWLASLNADSDKEEEIKSHVYNYCPPCKKIEDKI